MNDLDLCLEVVSRSRQPSRYIWCWISRKPLEIKVWFQRTINRKWHMGYRMVTWPMTSRDPQRRCEAVQSAVLATAWLLVTAVLSILLQWFLSNKQWPMLYHWATLLLELSSCLVARRCCDMLSVSLLIRYQSHYDQLLSLVSLIICYQALRKALFKPGAFFKGLILPLCQVWSIIIII